jgi:hypothetical protein
MRMNEALDWSRASPHPTMPWFVSILMMVCRIGTPSSFAILISVIFRSLDLAPVLMRFSSPTSVTVMSFHSSFGRVTER